MKFFWVKIWVMTIPKNAKFLVWWVYWMRNKGLVLPTFCTFQTPLTLLTNCALHWWCVGAKIYCCNQNCGGIYWELWRNILVQFSKCLFICCSLTMRYCGQMYFGIFQMILHLFCNLIQMLLSHSQYPTIHSDSAYLKFTINPT